MLIKICGITRPEDARAAIDAGVGALGFIFWPGSPRFIDPFRARAIARTLPPFVATVGVFVNQPQDHVNGVASLVGLSVVQLHGDETREYVARMRRPVLKAVALGAETPRVDGWAANTMLLLDAHDPARRGGTGRTIDWDRAGAIARQRPIVLSGGLTPENVGDAIGRVRPFGIDVSSGVEVSPGIKDPGRLADLFQAILYANSCTPRS
jgi:phosphoribosylanthranilate isomerase